MAERPTPTLLLGEPLAFRMLLDEAAKWARRSFRALYLPVAVPVAAAQVLLVVVQAVWMGSLFSTSTAAPEAVFGQFAGFGCAVVVFWLVVGLAYSALAAAAVDAAAGRAVSFRSRWLWVLRPKVVGVLFLSAMLAGVGMLFCILPGLFALVALGFLVPVMAEEGLVGLSTLQRSYELARFNPRRRLATLPMAKIAVLLVVGYILSYVASMVVQMPFVVAQQLLILREGIAGSDPAAVFGGGLLWLQVPGALLGSLAQTVVVLYLSMGMALLYFDVRRRREGSDLEAAIDELLGRGGAPPPAGPPPLPEGLPS